LKADDFSFNIKEEIQRAAQYIPADTPPQFKQLIERCLSMNPAQRPTFDEIAAKLEHIDLN